MRVLFLSCSILTGVLASTSFPPELTLYDKLLYPGQLFDPEADLEAAFASGKTKNTSKVKLSVPQKKSVPRNIIVTAGSAGASIPASSNIADGAASVLDLRVGTEIDVPGFGRVRIINLLYDEAVESRIFLASKPNSERPEDRVVIKTFTPKKRGDFEELNSEVAALRTLSDVPSVIHLIHAPGVTFKTPKNKEFRYCVLEVLYTSLAGLADGRFAAGVPQETLSRIAVKGITALQAVHEKKYVHGDVGIGNLMFADEELNNLKLIDFGYAKLYEIDGEHVEPGAVPLPEFSRTLLSISELDGHNPSRKDDMFRFGEVLLKLLSTDYNRQFRSSKVEDIRRIKMKSIPTKCCAGATPGMDKYFDYVRGLEYIDAPDYDLLRSFFAGEIL
jgi:serine/threonine protein kinase